MLITILGIIFILIILFISIWEVDEKYIDGRYRKRLGLRSMDIEWLAISMLIGLLIGATIIPVIFIQVNKEYRYDTAEMNREMLVLRLEEYRTLEDDASILPSHKYQAMTSLYDDIYSFNSGVLYSQRYRDSFIFGWYVSPLIGDLETIDFT